MQASQILEIVIVTHLYDVPQLNLPLLSMLFQARKPLCCLTSLAFITLFSFQGATFQPLLKPDRNTQSLECFDLISNGGD